MSSMSFFEKYNIPAPRYTSYPTVPHWHNKPSEEEWIDSLKDSFAQDSLNWSMYVHIPFCQTLCHYCGCNRKILRHHKMDDPYVGWLTQEFDYYLSKIPQIKKHPLKAFHFGGGTPTFLSAQLLGQLVDHIFKDIKVSETGFEGSIEIDPRTTNRDQLQTLFDRGFNRVSLGVQDFNENVQKLINRIQSFQVTESITEMSREIGYDSVNFDLIYGLPGQGLKEIKHTIDQTLLLKPDRIALYSLAIIPWVSPAQRLFKDSDLPSPDVKRQLYETAREALIKAGYVDIGMDHFSLKSDNLYKARENNQLHRNFMGYTDQNYDVMLSLGVSSISETPNMFFQNFKDVNEYKEAIEAQQLATYNGHKLSAVDMSIKKQILQLATQFKVPLTLDQIEPAKLFLKSYIEDKLVTIDNHWLHITPAGEPFLRNICMALDVYIQNNKQQNQQFSKSI